MDDEVRMWALWGLAKWRSFQAVISQLQKFESKFVDRKFGFASDQPVNRFPAGNRDHVLDRKIAWKRLMQSRISRISIYTKQLDDQASDWI